MVMNNRKAFTLVELLITLLIIVVLLGILLPSIATVRRIARDTAQKAQFNSIGIALEAFKQDRGDYPDSNRYDGTYPAYSYDYCGAMKLAEAMVGQDLKGFNPKSNFELQGFDLTAPWDGMPYPPYNTCGGAENIPCYAENVKSRRMYLQLETASPHLLSDIYTPSHLTYGNYAPSIFVLCDVYKRTMKTGNKTGMPILYYRADISKVKHDWWNREDSTYCSTDNQVLVNIYLPWYPTPPPETAAYVHPMAVGIANGQTLSGVPLDPNIFYTETRDKRVPSGDRPYNPTTYILMSAGADGQYGTSDDIFNGF